MLKRCKWSSGNELMIKYHDEEWGVPVHDDKKLFELIVLEIAQAGLSWSTILNRREGYREALGDVNKVAKYTEKDVKRLMSDKGIIRNRLKIKYTISNAKRFIEIQKEFGSFDKYIWGFVNHKTTISGNKVIPADVMSKDLKKRGFKFVGSTICYAFMQAAGLVNDHTIDCFRYEVCQKPSLNLNPKKNVPFLHHDIL
jgi:DNA-3-methyladenine glycosylase I